MIPVTMILVVAVVLTVALVSTLQYEASSRLLYQNNNLEQSIFGLQVSSSVHGKQGRDIAAGAILVTIDQVAAAAEEEPG